MTEKPKNAKGFGRIMLFLGVAIVLGIVLMAAILWRITDNEPEQMRKHLDNPLINAGFHDWQSWEIPEIGRLWYPTDWELIQSEDGCTLISKDGRITGYGTAIGTQDATFSSGPAFWSNRYGYSVEDIRYLRNALGGSAHISKGFLAKWAAGDDMLYVITLNVESAGEGNKHFSIAFESAQFESESEFRQLAEAIAYAFSFA